MTQKKKNTEFSNISTSIPHKKNVYFYYLILRVDLIVKNIRGKGDSLTNQYMPNQNIIQKSA